MSDAQGRKKEKNQHIQVFVRVRPANQAEIHGKSSTVVEVASPRECIVRERPQDKLTKKFTFDKVFGPSSKQLDVYNAVVSPLLDEVLAGYNCTVFAYGQTGTGKTFTMEGLSNDPAIHWQSDTTAGIIPRSLSHLFDELRMMESQEYTVRVSFLELYNEELFDLLSPNDDASKIRLFEDATKKGAVIIHGLEEVTVHNKNEVYKILEKGSEKRQTAATLMNAHSSRSHTVFSITVHIKENTVDGEELLKTGKLNLVDLAGSENVGRSGAVDRRAREAGNINQSLLTLGRVITALVERAPHIPYRESKLTRLLQESLGGRTKTSIIATVSPASVNLEETLSTLDYAHRAKNITNRPEINQKLSKKALLKEYTEEIERLRRDLTATRERNGVYIAAENYNEMQSTIEFQEKEIEEKINHIKVLEETMAAKEQLLMELKIDLDNTKHKVVVTQQERDEQKYLVDIHVNTEKKLLKQAKTLVEVADTATDDTFKLHDKIARKKNIEMENATIGEEFRMNIAEQFDNIQKDLARYAKESTEFYSLSTEKIAEQSKISSKFSAETIQRLSCDFIKEQQSVADELTKNIELSYDNYGKWFLDEINNATTMTDSERDGLKKIAETFAPKISNLVQNSIDENLRIINEQTTKHLINLRDNMKNNMESIMNKYINENNLLKKKIESLSNDLDNAKELIDELVENEDRFTQLYYENSTKLREQRKQLKEAFDNKYQSGSNACKNANSQVEDMSSLKTSIDTFIGEDLYKTVTSISEELSGQLENNRKLSQATVEQSEIIKSKLITELENTCEHLSEYINQFEARTNGYQRCMNADHQKTLSSIANEKKIIVNTTKYHLERTESHRKVLENISAEFNTRLNKQNSNTIDWNDKLKSNLTDAKTQVEQFLNTGLKHDTPTGSTPAKKDFSYPRQLVMTSPHERLLQRYRQSNPIPDTNDDSLGSPLSLTIQQESTSTYSPSNQTIMNYPLQFSTPNDVTNTNRESFSFSIPMNNNQKKFSNDISDHSIITKSASVSDLSAIVNNNITNDSIVKSESEIFNKENGGDSGFVKPSLRQPKFGMKTRTVNSNGKRILSSRNE